MSEHRLGRDVFLALAAVGWSDGKLHEEEADAIVSEGGTGVMTSPRRPAAGRSLLEDEWLLLAPAAGELKAGE